MVSAQWTPIHSDASKQDAFFMYWGRPLKISTALNPKKKPSNYENNWDRVVVVTLRRYHPLNICIYVKKYHLPTPALSPSQTFRPKMAQL